MSHRVTPPTRESRVVHWHAHFYGWYWDCPDCGTICQRLWDNQFGAYNDWYARHKPTCTPRPMTPSWRYSRQKQP